ncbi:hypothetical protein FHG87_023823, partial [Trinorchestia longiramus]
HPPSTLILPAHSPCPPLCRCQQGWQDFIDALSASAHLPPSLLSQAVAVHAGNEASLPATPASALEDLRLLLQHLSTTAGGAAGDEHGCSGECSRPTNTVTAVHVPPTQ